MLNQFNTSLWGDEAFSAILSMKSVTEIVKIITHDTSPPLYNLTEHFWFQLFGTSEVAIRALSFLYYLIAVYFVFKIGEYLWNRKTGLLAAVLAFLNPFFFIYAFEGRMYSILALGVTASMYFFIKIIFSKKVRTLDQVGYISATAWALYSHHFAIFAIFVQGLWFFILLITRHKAHTIRLLVSFITIGILYSPWLLPLYSQTKMVGTGFWLGRPDLKILLGVILEYLAGGIRNANLNLLYFPLYQIAVVLALFILALRQWLNDTKKTLILLSWFLGPILATWLVSQKFTSIFYDRYLLYAIPAVMLILASNLRKFGIYLALVFIGLLVFIDYSYFTHPTKRPFRELASYVLEVKKGDDYLINWNSAAHHLWESKYYGIPAPLYIPQNVALPYFVGTALMTKDDIINKIPDKIDVPCPQNITCKSPNSIKVNRVGVITSGEVAEISLPGYTELESKSFGDLKFVWFRK
jgi:mannosyltransferase